MLNGMMYNTQGKLPSRRPTSCRWSPFESLKSPERRCLGHGMRISRHRSSERRQGSGRVPRPMMRTHPPRIVMTRSRRGGSSAIIRRYYRAWSGQFGKTEQSTPTHPHSASPLMTLTANEISDLNDLLIKLSLSEPMSGVVMGEDLDIQTEPLHDDGKPREAFTALTCPTPKIPSLTLSSPLLDLPDLNLDLEVALESRPEVQNVLVQLMEHGNKQDESTPARILPLDSEAEKVTEKPSDDASKESAPTASEDEKQLAVVTQKSAGISSNDGTPSYRIILLILILLHYSRELNKGFVVPDQALDIIQHLELCRSRALPVITPDPADC